MIRARRKEGLCETSVEVHGAVYQAQLKPVLRNAVGGAQSNKQRTESSDLPSDKQCTDRLGGVC